MSCTYLVLLSAPTGTSSHASRSAAEAYDAAAALRRTLGGAGTTLQVVEEASGAVLGEWRHDGEVWLLESDARPEGTRAG